MRFRECKGSPHPTKPPATLRQGCLGSTPHPAARASHRQTRLLERCHVRQNPPLLHGFLQQRGGEATRRRTRRQQRAAQAGVVKLDGLPASDEVHRRVGGGLAT